MKAFKHMTAFVLALVMAAALAVTAYAASVTVKYRVYVYSDEITFRQYDYSQSTTPSITNLTISATSSLGSGSALYHMKYADGAVAYCIEPGVHSDDSGTYKEGSSASWYNLPASVQSGIALAMSLGYPSADYGAASGDRNSSAIINAEKWAATQAIIWELICEYRNAYTYDDWGYSPFYGCVDTSRYPTFELWYDKIATAMQNATMIPSFAEYAPRWCDTIELRRNAAGSYTATVTDDNAVLGDYNFTANSGSGITFTRKGNTLTITATAAAAKNLDTEKTYSATGSAYEIDPDRAVICWYDRTGRYQAMAGYTGVGRDPVKAYIKIKTVEAKGSITVRNLLFCVKHRPMALTKELSFLPINARDEFDVLRRQLQGEDFTQLYLDEELQLAEQMFPPPEAEEVKRLLQSRAELSDVRRAAAIYKLQRYSYNGNGDSYGVSSCDIQRFFRDIWECSHRLKDVALENKDFESIITTHNDPQTTVYCDPPYYEAERYAVEFPHSDHQRLHDVLAQHTGFAMVSYNNCDYIRRLYEDFFIYEVERPNSQSKKKNDIYREYIMTNYDPRVFASQMTIFGDYSSDGKICRLVHIPERPLRT